MDDYLQSSPIIDWHHPHVLEQARAIAASHTTLQAIAQACFEWVRDTIHHSIDHPSPTVTCTASEVLQHRTGFCYAKSHLLAALLRANQIPTGFCYQRLSLDDRGAPYCLHGFNAVHLPGIGWYRLDARGNRTGINAQFTPPHEQLAYLPQLPGEIDFPEIWPEPLPVVIQALQTHRTLPELLSHLPDRTPS